MAKSGRSEMSNPMQDVLEFYRATGENDQKRYTTTQGQELRAWLRAHPGWRVVSMANIPNFASSSRGPGNMLTVVVEKPSNPA